MKPSRSKSFRPAVEALENRTNMSSSVSTSGVLTILGGPETTNDTVFVTEDLDANTIRVSQQLNDQPALVETFPRQGITRIEASLGSGNDSFNYRLGGESDYTDYRSIKVDLGSGNDTAVFGLTPQGADGQAVLRGHMGIGVYGGAGRDRIQATFGRIDNPVTDPGDEPAISVVFSAVPGAGNDTVTANYTGDLIGQTTVEFTVREANDALRLGGNDSITVLANSDVDIDPDSFLLVKAFGASGADRIRFDYRGEVNGEVYADLFGGPATDMVRAAITLDRGSHGALSVSLRGDEATDDVVLLLLTDNSNDGVFYYRAEALQD